MDNRPPCIYFNTKSCTKPSCQFSHLPDANSVQIAPNCPNICKSYLLDPKGCHRHPGTCWYSHDVLSGGHTSWQKLYDLLSEIRKKEFEISRRYDTGSFVARFMGMLVEERYARDGISFVAADDGTGMAARSVIGDEVLARLGMRPDMDNQAKRKREYEEENTRRSKVVKIKEEPIDDAERNPLRDVPNRLSSQPTVDPKIKTEPRDVPNRPPPRATRTPKFKANVHDGPNRPLFGPTSHPKIKTEPGLEGPMLGTAGTEETGETARPVQQKKKKMKSKKKKKNGMDRAQPGMSARETELPGRDAQQRGLEAHRRAIEANQRRIIAQQGTVSQRVRDAQHRGLEAHQRAIEVHPRARETQQQVDHIGHRPAELNPSRFEDLERRHTALTDQGLESAL